MDSHPEGGRGEHDQQARRQSDTVATDRLATGDRTFVDTHRQTIATAFRSVTSATHYGPHETATYTRNGSEFDRSTEHTADARPFDARMDAIQSIFPDGAVEGRTLIVPQTRDGGYQLQIADPIEGFITEITFTDEADFQTVLRELAENTGVAYNMLMGRLRSLYGDDGQYRSDADTTRFEDTILHRRDHRVRGLISLEDQLSRADVHPVNGELSPQVLREKMAIIDRALTEDEYREHVEPMLGDMNTLDEQVAVSRRLTERLNDKSLPPHRAVFYLTNMAQVEQILTEIGDDRFTEDQRETIRAQAQMIFNSDIPRPAANFVWSTDSDGRLRPPLILPGSYPEPRLQTRTGTDEPPPPPGGPPSRRRTDGGADDQPRPPVPAPTGNRQDNPINRLGRQPRPPEPAPTPTPTREQEEYEIDIAGRQEDVEKRIREEVEFQLRAAYEKGRWWTPVNWVRRIALKFGEEYYRHRGIQKLREAVIENNNTFYRINVIGRGANRLTFDPDQYQAQERRAGDFKLEQIRNAAYANMGREVQFLARAQDGINLLLIQQVLNPIIADPTADHARVQELLRTFVRGNLNDRQVQDFFGVNATEFRRVSEMFATNILTVAGRLRQQQQERNFNTEQMQAFMAEKVKFRFANVRWGADTQTRLTRTDRAIVWLESRRWLGGRQIANEAAAGAIATIAIQSAKLGTRWALRAALITGGLFAALERRKNLNRDMAAMRVDVEYGRTGLDRPQRTGAGRMLNALDTQRKLQRYTYATASVAQMLDGDPDREFVVGGETRGLNQLIDLLRANPTDINIRRALAIRIAEIRERQRFGASEGRGVTEFQDRYIVEEQRAQLIAGVVRGKEALRDLAGMDNDAIEAAIQEWQGQWETRFTANTSEQDRRFRRYRLRSTLTFTAFGSVAGLVTSLGTQWFIAEGQRHALGQQVRPTFIENPKSIPRAVLGGRVSDFLHLPGEQAPPTSGGALREAIQNAKPFEPTYVDDLEFHTGQNGQIFLDSVGGKPFSTDIPLGYNPQNGSLFFQGSVPPPIAAELQDAGFNIGDSDLISDALGLNNQTVTETLPNTDIKINIPAGTELRQVGSTFELWTKDSNPILLANQLTFDETGHMTGSNILHPELVQIGESSTGPNITIDTDTWLKEHAATVDRWGWYNELISGKSDQNELRLYDRRIGAGQAVQWDVTHMQGLSTNTAGLLPPVDVQDAIQNNQVAMAFWSRGNPDQAVLVLMDHGKLTLDQNSTDMVTAYIDGKWQETSEAEVGRMVFDQDLGDYKSASNATGHMDKFNVNSSAVIVVEKPDGSVELRSLATALGRGQLPDLITQPIEITSITSIQQAITPIELPSGAEAPLVGLPYTPRRPLRNRRDRPQDPLIPRTLGQRVDSAIQGARERRRARRDRDNLGGTRPPAPESRAPLLTRGQPRELGQRGAIIPLAANTLFSDRRLRDIDISDRDRVRFNFSQGRPRHIDLSPTVTDPSGFSHRVGNVYLNPNNPNDNNYYVTMRGNYGDGRTEMVYPLSQVLRWYEVQAQTSPTRRTQTQSTQGVLRYVQQPNGQSTPQYGNLRDLLGREPNDRERPLVEVGISAEDLLFLQVVRDRLRFRRRRRFVNEELETLRRTAQTQGPENAMNALLQRLRLDPYNISDQELHRMRNAPTARIVGTNRSSSPSLTPETIYPMGRDDLISAEGLTLEGRPIRGIRASNRDNRGITIYYADGRSRDIARRRRATDGTTYDIQYPVRMSDGSIYAQVTTSTGETPIMPLEQLITFAGEDITFEIDTPVGSISDLSLSQSILSPEGYPYYLQVLPPNDAQEITVVSQYRDPRSIPVNQLSRWGFLTTPDGDPAGLERYLGTVFFGNDRNQAIHIMRDYMDNATTNGNDLSPRVAAEIFLRTLIGIRREDRLGRERRFTDEFTDDVGHFADDITRPFVGDADAATRERYQDLTANLYNRLARLIPAPRSASSGPATSGLTAEGAAVGRSSPTERDRGEDLGRTLILYYEPDPDRGLRAIYGNERQAERLLGRGLYQQDVDLLRSGVSIDHIRLLRELGDRQNPPGLRNRDVNRLLGMVTRYGAPVAIERFLSSFWEHHPEELRDAAIRRTGQPFRTPVGEELARLRGRDSSANIPPSRLTPRDPNAPRRLRDRAFGPRARMDADTIRTVRGGLVSAPVATPAALGAATTPLPRDVLGRTDEAVPTADLAAQAPASSERRSVSETELRRITELQAEMAGILSSASVIQVERQGQNADRYQTQSSGGQQIFERIDQLDDLTTYDHERIVVQDAADRSLSIRTQFENALLLGNSLPERIIASGYGILTGGHNVVQISYPQHRNGGTQMNLLTVVFDTREAYDRYLDQLQQNPTTAVLLTLARRANDYDSRGMYTGDPRSDRNTALQRAIIDAESAPRMIEGGRRGEGPVQESILYWEPAVPPSPDTGSAPPDLGGLAENELIDRAFAASAVSYNAHGPDGGQNYLPQPNQGDTLGAFGPWGERGFQSSSLAAQSLSPDTPPEEMIIEAVHFGPAKRIVSQPYEVEVPRGGLRGLVGGRRQETRYEQVLADRETPPGQERLYTVSYVYDPRLAGNSASSTGIPYWPTPHDNRPGAMIQMDWTMPESLARELIRRAEENPQVMRDFVDATAHRIGSQAFHVDQEIFNGLWERRVRRDGAPPTGYQPPWEQWPSNRMHFFEELPPNESGNQNAIDQSPPIVYPDQIQPRYTFDQTHRHFRPSRTPTPPPLSSRERVPIVAADLPPATLDERVGYYHTDPEELRQRLAREDNSTMRAMLALRVFADTGERLKGLPEDIPTIEVVIRSLENPDTPGEALSEFATQHQRLTALVNEIREGLETQALPIRPTGATPDAGEPDDGGNDGGFSLL